MKLNEKSEFTLDLKTIGIVVAMAVSVSSTYFTLKADIDENKRKVRIHIRFKNYHYGGWFCNILICNLFYIKSRY